MGEPLSLDPGVIMDSESKKIAANIFETLVKKDAEGKFQPGLAKNWSVSGNGKIWTFYLQQGVYFHDNTPFNARAVKFSWERQRDINHPYHNPGYGRFVFYRAIWGGYPGNIKKITVVDSHTVKVELFSRSTNFLDIISNIQFAVVSPTAVMTKGASFSKEPIGTGPFRFVEWRRWHRIVLTHYLEYWGKKPYLERLIFEPTPGDLTRRRQIRRARIDLMENPTRVVLDRIKAGKLGHLKIKSMSARNFSYISLNCSKPPLDNLLIRKGLNFAVNKKRILNRIYEWMPPAASPIGRLWGTAISGRAFPVNHGTARALFKKAGMPHFTLELRYPMLPRPFAASPEKIAREIASDLKECGVRVKLRGMKWETYLEKLRYGEHQAALTGCTGIKAYPQLYYKIHWDRNNAVLGGTNLSFYRNDKIHRLLREIHFSSDKNVLLKAFKGIQDIIADDAAIIPLYHNQTVLVMDTRVMGINMDEDGIIDFSRVWLKK